MRTESRHRVDHLYRSQPRRFPTRAPTSRMSEFDPATGRAAGGGKSIELTVGKPAGGHAGY